MMDNQIVTDGRQVYGVLDLIGDIGGLVDGLIAVSSILVWFLQLLIGNSGQKYLLSNIFHRDNSDKAQNSSTNEKLSLLSKRKPFDPGRITLCKRRKKR